MVEVRQLGQGNLCDQRDFLRDGTEGGHDSHSKGLHFGLDLNETSWVGMRKMLQSQGSLQGPWDRLRGGKYSLMFEGQTRQNRGIKSHCCWGDDSKQSWEQTGEIGRNCGLDSSLEDFVVPLLSRKGLDRFNPSIAQRQKKSVDVEGCFCLFDQPR